MMMKKLMFTMTGTWLPIAFNGKRHQYLLIVINEISVRISYINLVLLLQINELIQLN